MVLRDRDQDNAFGDVATEGFYVFGQFGQFVGTMVEVEQSVRINSLRSSFSVSSWNRQTMNLSCMLKNVTTLLFAIICYTRCTVTCINVVDVVNSAAFFNLILSHG